MLVRALKYAVQRAGLFRFFAALRIEHVSIARKYERGLGHFLLALRSKSNQSISKLRLMLLYLV